ncbi:MAG: hypothetical protein ACM31C_02820 [Acidobacteriota bacterium]
MQPSHHEVDAGPDASHGDAPADGPPPTTAVSATGAAAFTAANNAFTRVPYGSVAYDDRSELDTSTSTFTAKAAGDYMVCAGLRINSAPVGFELDLFKNGSRERAFARTVSYVATGCRPIRLAAGDSVDVRVWQSSGADLSLAPDSYWNWLTIDRVQSTAGAAVASTATMSLPNATFVKIPYSAVLFDDAAQYDSINSGFVAASAGDYQVCAEKLLSYGGTLGGEIDVYINDVRERAIAGGVGSVGGCRTVHVSAGDTISVWLYQDSGSTQTITANTQWDWLAIQPLPIAVSTDGLLAFTAAQTTFTPVPYTGVIRDDLHEFDASSHTFTAAAAGDYELCASLGTGSTSGELDELDVYKNGTREKALQSASPYGTLGGCRVLRLVAQDQLQLDFYSPAPSTSMNGDVYWDWLELARLK